MKKRTIIISCLLVAALIAGGVYGASYLLRNSGTTVPVYSVASKNMGYYDYNVSSSGTVTSKATQEVYLDTNELVDQVYVKEGDKVQIGDKLLSYDTTLLELDLEASQLEKEATELELKGAQADLQTLQSTTPIPDSETEGYDSYLDEWDSWEGSDYTYDDSSSSDSSLGDYEASIIPNPSLNMLTASSGLVVIGDGSSDGGTGVVNIGGNSGSSQTESAAQSETLAASSEPSSGGGQPASETTPSESQSDSTEPVSQTPSEPASTEPVQTEPPTTSQTESPGNGGTINITPEPDTPQEPTTPAGTEPATPDATEPVQTEPQTDSDGTLIINPGEDGTEPTTESETETETEIETSPLGRLKAYKVLNYRTKPYKGEGTKEKPYVFFCVDGAIVQASFMNKLLGFNEAGTSRKNGGILEDGEGCYAILEIREGDDMSGGFIKSIQINGTVPVDKAFAPDVTWTFTTNGLQKNVPEITEPSTEPDTEDPGDWIDDDFQFWDDGEQYTVSELQQAITDKKAEIQELELTLRENDLEIAKNQRELDNATVVSSIHGVVKTVGDVSVVSDDGEPFILVTSDSGLYIQGTINEMDLDKYTVGTEITATSWDSYETVTAEITEISEYPASSLSYWSSSENMNVSAYPFLAYVAEPGSLAEGDGVEIQFEQEVNADSTGIYLEKMYVRSENGQSYVYIDDGNGRLKKQYVKTGKNSYGTVEILEGLTLNDKIAFPYSADAKEGARTRNGDAFSGDDSYSGEDSSYSGDGSYSGEDSSYSGDGSYLGEDSSYSGDGSYLGEDSSYSGDGSYSGGDSYLGEVSSYSGEDSYLGEDTYLGEGTYLGEDSYLEDTYSGESSDGSYFGDTYSGEDF